MAFTWEQFHKKCSWTYSVTCLQNPLLKLLQLLPGTNELIHRHHKHACTWQITFSTHCWDRKSLCLGSNILYASYNMRGLIHKTQRCLKEMDGNGPVFWAIFWAPQYLDSEVKISSHTNTQPLLSYQQPSMPLLMIRQFSRQPFLSMQYSLSLSPAASGPGKFSEKSIGLSSPPCPTP